MQRRDETIGERLDRLRESADPDIQWLVRMMDSDVLEELDLDEACDEDCTRLGPWLESRTFSHMLIKLADGTEVGARLVSRGPQHDGTDHFAVYLHHSRGISIRVDDLIEIQAPHTTWTVRVAEVTEDGRPHDFIISVPDEQDDMAEPEPPIPQEFSVVWNRTTPVPGLGYLEPHRTSYIASLHQDTEAVAADFLLAIRHVYPLARIISIRARNSP